MTLVLELPPIIEAGLQEKAARAGQSLDAYALDVLQADVAGQEAAPSEGTAADLFAGRLGRIRSGGTGHWSEDTGTKFAQGLSDDRENGRL